MAFTGPLEDRVRITELLASYADAVIRADAAAYLACWTDDAVRTGSGGECRGKAELRVQWEQIWLAMEQMTFLTQAAAIDVTGDRATARSSRDPSRTARYAFDETAGAHTRSEHP